MSEGQLHWHKKDLKEAYQILNTSQEGLSSKESAERLDKYGFNVLKEIKKKTVFMMFLDQFKDFMIMVLIAAAVVSGIIGELVDTIAIIVIVILNAIIGFVQEYRAEKAMKALKAMSAPSALAAARLKIEEAALTGESIPVEKSNELLPEESIPIGDRINMAFKGTTVSYGRGTGIVTSTGMQTELGKIATLIQEEDEVKTPLQKRLAKFGQRLGIIVLAICAIVFITGLMRGEAALLMFLTAISLAVAAIPEALPAVVTISLAIGAKKMVRQNALVRKLPAVETLGSVTYICSDKTGTLTMNRMTVDEIYINGEIVKGSEIRMQGSESETGSLEGEDSLSMFMTSMAVSNDAVMDKDGSVIGDPTEVALFEIAQKNGFDKTGLEKQFQRIAEIPFDSDRKCMTTFHRKSDGRIISFTKGALESILDNSSDVYSEKDIINLNEEMRNSITDSNKNMANDGLRTLALAMRQWDVLPDDITPDTAENHLTFLGAAGLLDPPREEANEAVSVCKTAGIKPVMITGDHPLTAKTIARRLGIIDDREEVITGQDLDELTMDEFEDKVEHIRVYARVAPEQKIKIVRALQDKGEFVAMTGDGVNDAPALKRADIGVAMGVTGTDVSKEASHMILLDDNFATIIKAVKEGRRIFDNIRKFIKYTMTSNSGEIWTIFLPPFLGLPIPLLPIHILWINLVTDGLPGLALAVEPAEDEIMKKPPRHPKESIFAHGLGYHLFWVGLLMGSVSIFTQAWFMKTGGTHWQTMVFTVLSLSQMGHVLAIRSDKESLFKIGLLSNKPLLGAVFLTFLLQMATIYIPFLNPVFKTAPLTAGELFVTLVLSSFVFIAVEIEKWFLRRRERATSD
jgi:Ca2+-transporting ATPase